MASPALSAEEQQEVFAQFHAARRAFIQQQSRLAIPTQTRLPLATGLSFLLGLVVGGANGSSTTGLRYRAENAHRLPNTRAGWFLYHKTKNYQMAWGGLRDGLRSGGQLAFWTASFLLMENGLDVFRNTKDFLNTTLAGLSIAGAFSVWSGFPMPAVIRTTKQGLVVGLIYGLAQDAAGYARGRRPRYADFVDFSRWPGRRTKHEQSSTT